MTKEEEKGALALAQALARYNAMEDPIEAHTALHSEWPSAIADLLDPVFWAEVEIRSVEETARDLHALHQKAHNNSKAVNDYLSKKRRLQ